MTPFTPFCSPFRLLPAFLILCAVGYPVRSFAQVLDVNEAPYQSAEQTMGCRRFSALPPLPTARLASCQDGDSVEVSMLLKPGSDGVPREKKVRGQYQFREYKIGEIDQPYAFDTFLRSLPMAGFTVKYSNKPSTITARDGDTWMLINLGDDFYGVSVVQAPPDVWTQVKTAKDIATEMQVHDHVDIYGIEFSPDDQAIVEAKSPILLEIAQFLKQDPGISIIIESDKVSPRGASDDDAEITRERANAVMDWLIAHGIDRNRLQPWPAGHNNPVTDNESPSEIQRNERIVLKKNTPTGAVSAPR
jgi:outer membrane protein OmpA-like peptidoglycan-associated protein